MSSDVVRILSFGKIAFLIVAFLVIITSTSVFIVNERDQAVVLRFGEIQRVLTEPGIYFKIPTNVVDTVQIVDARLLRLDIDDIRVQVRDGRWYLVDAFVAFRITDLAKFRSAIGGSLMRARSNMRTQLDAALRRVYGRRSFEAALSELRVEMMREVRDQLRQQLGNLGIEVTDVRIRRTDLTPEVSHQTFDRMRSERLAEAAELRAKGTEKALQIRAQADREAVGILAQANRESEMVRGEGDAKRNRIFANAFGRDPDFFSFYRSMQAYRVSMTGDGSTRATMVLSPTSPFFRHFSWERTDKSKAADR